MRPTFPGQLCALLPTTEPAGGARRRSPWRVVGPALLALGGVAIYLSVLLAPWNRIFRPHGNYLLTAAAAKAGHPYAPGEPVELSAQTDQSTWLLVLALADGRALQVFPANGGDPKPLDPGLTVSFPVMLASGAGPEVLLAEFCRSPLPAVTLQKAGERALATAGAPERVRGLDLGCAEVLRRLDRSAPGSPAAPKLR